MGKFEYRLGNPIPSVFEPKNSVTEKDYYEFFKDYSRIGPNLIQDLVKGFSGYMDYVSRLGQDYIVVTAGSEEFADTLMSKLNKQFEMQILLNRKTEVDSYGVSLEKLAKINYVKHVPDNTLPIIAFQGSGLTSSGYYDD